ncbi:MAG: hypothetical protein EOM59_05005 [Clostridia bacterium]|nr:hypothetical protein [Clostridia bacterium]
MLKLKTRKTKIFPTKKTMNLMQKDGIAQSPMRVIFMLLLLALLVFVVFKFGVFNQMYDYYTANSQVKEIEANLKSARTQNENYNTVYEEYSRYYYSGFTEAEDARVQRMQAIKLIDDYMLAVGFAGAYTITDNTISINLKGITLTQTSELIAALYQNERVVSVNIQTAGSDVDRPETVSMNVVLKNVEEQ